VIVVVVIDTIGLISVVEVEVVVVVVFIDTIGLISVVEIEVVVVIVIVDTKGTAHKRSLKEKLRKLDLQNRIYYLCI
jgi:hypothetical protein